jgi:hypothetical protein
MPNDSAQFSVAFMGRECPRDVSRFLRAFENHAKRRKDNDAGRFIKAMSGYIGKGLRYAKLIGQDGDGRPPSETWQTA